MKAGDIVAVYEKPFTHEKFEGMAQVIRIVNPNAGRWEGKPVVRAMVIFNDDGPNARPVERTIYDTEVEA